MWTTYNTARRAWERLAQSRMCYAPPCWHSHCFPLSPLARQRPERINRALNLAQSLSSSLMKCNLPSPNTIHHTAARAPVCERVCVYTRCPSVSASPSLVFSFSVLQTAGTQIELEWLQQRRQNKSSSPTRLFSAFCFAWPKTHTLNFLSIRSLSENLNYIWFSRGVTLCRLSRVTFHCWFM